MSDLEREITARIEAALYASGRALDAEQLARAGGITSKRRAVAEARSIAKVMNSAMRAIEVVEYPGPRFAMQLKKEYNPVARRFATKHLLTRGALKTLSFIAYFQPIASSDLATRRGPQAYSHLKELEEVGFVVWQRLGRSRSYSTTREFCEYFGLSPETQELKRQLEARSMIIK